MVDVTRGSPRLGDDDVTSEIPTRNPPGDGSVWNGSFRNHRRGSFEIRPPSGLADTDSPDGKTSKAVFDIVLPRDKAEKVGDGIADNDRPRSIPVVQAPKFHMPCEIERTSSDDSSSVSSSSQPSPTVIAASTSSRDMASIINR